MTRSFKIGVLFCAVIVTFGNMLAAPAVKLLQADFPHVSGLLLQWVVTLSSLFILPTLFLAGYLSKRISKKSILILGLVIYLIGGIGPAFMNSITWILVFRAILGLGIGFVAPTYNAVIAENTQGTERSHMNGLVTAVNGIGGAIFLSVGGFIAAYGWRSVFLCYAYALVILLMVIFLIPKNKTLPLQKPTEPAAGSGTAAPLPRSFYGLVLGSGLHVMLFYVLPTTLSLYLAETHLGGTSTVGILMALSLLSVFAAGLSVTGLTHRIPNAVVPLALALYAAGFLMESMATNLVVAALSILMIGFAQGLLFPVSLNKTAESVPKERITTAFSVLLASLYLFQFLAPLFVHGVQSLLHLSTYRETYLFLAAAAGLSFFVALALKVKSKTGNKLHPQNNEVKGS